MRRRPTPIGWPRRDSRHYRFAIPNAVWEYHLKPVEFAIFSYLCYHLSTDTLTPEIIAEGVHLSVSTTKKYLKALVSRGLVTAEWSLALNNQCITSEKFFTLPNELFLLKLSPSAFMIYAYLLLIEDRRTHTCHPSYNTIATATDLAKNTVMKGISTLSELNLITVDKHRMKWKGNNLYTILPVRAAVDTFHRRQLHQVELDAERRRILRQQQEYDRRHPRATLCATTVAEAAPDPPQQYKPLCAC